MSVDPSGTDAPQTDATDDQLDELLTRVDRGIEQSLNDHIDFEAGLAAVEAEAERRSADALDLIRGLNTGDPEALDAVVVQYHNVVWSVIRSFRLNPVDAADVSQIVWLRLIENLARITETTDLALWLVTTARRESIQWLHAAHRQVPDGLHELELAGGSADSDTPELAVLALEEKAMVMEAMRRLSPRCQKVLGTVALGSADTYQELSAALGIPVGSLGPIRARCLAHLRREFNLLRAEHDPEPQPASVLTDSPFKLPGQ
jgi:RNA polymerase sigma factor (sigma-70 family)